jgi:glycosyltransferase involved in cell wall biosynthesis
MRYACCITTFNEEETIGDLVRELREYGHDVYVVDDGSTDFTVNEAELAGADVTNTGGRWGIAQSLMLAWKIALHNPAQYDAIIQIDAGGSHFPYDHLEMVKAHEEGAQMMIGSRFIHLSHYAYQRNPVTFRRKNTLRPWLSRLAATMCNFAQDGSYISDWTSGYRLFSRKCALYLLTKRYEARMHGWQIEILAYAQARGFKVVETPIYYQAGRSSFNWRVANEAFKAWLHVANHVGWVGSNLDER